MDNLRYLIETYNSNEELSVEDNISNVVKNNPSFSDLTKEETVELKRQFMEYLQHEETSYIAEEYEERKNRRLAGAGYKERPESRALEHITYQRKRPRIKYVEAFVNNISVPKTLDEMYEFYLDGNDAQNLVESANDSGTTCWTSPRWSRRGDIVLFMHAKTAKTSLTRLRTEVRTHLSSGSAEAQQLERAISEQIDFYKMYGGKIFAIGRINGKPEKEEVNPLLHFKSRVFCDVNGLCLLDSPIDISEFNHFITISRLSAITPVFGDNFDELKEMIAEKNDVPAYFLNSYSTPYPSSRVNWENWMKLSLEYRNSFTLEIQFRQCYVDYLLKKLGDQKTISAECTCYKGTNPVTYVDNVIQIGRKLLPVEVKLNIKLENDLEGQCEQYCKLDKLILSKKQKRQARMQDLVDDRILIIDTYAVYMFYLKDRSIKVLFDLSDLKSEEDIRELRRIVLNNMDMQNDDE